jgi:hypothetical protein
VADRADTLTSHFPTFARSSQAWRRFAFAAVLLALLVLESLWFYWVFSEPLPNAANSGGGQIRRSIFLWRALPEVVPGVTWAQSYIGSAFRELSHLENLPQRGPIVLAALFIAAAAVSLGRLVIGWLGLNRAMSRVERLALAYPLGTSVLGVLTLVGGRLGLLSPWPVRVALGLFAAAGVWPALRRGQSVVPSPPVGVGEGGRGAAEGGGQPAVDHTLALSPPARLGLALIAGPFLALMALAAMLPTIDFDALEYHLQCPKEYFLAGKIAFLPHNVYASMPFGVEMLHLLGMETLGDWWHGGLTGQLLVMFFAPAAAVLIGGTAGRIASPRAGWVAAVVYLTTPWIYRLAAIPYVEGPLACYHAALIHGSWFMVHGPRSGSSSTINHRSWTILLGLLAGGAMACKYPALVSAVIPFGAFVLVQAFRERSVAPVLAFATGVAVAIGPWLVKNVIDTGNPVYPLGYTVFGGRDWDAQREAKWVNAHGPREIALRPLVDGLLDVAGRSDWQSPLFTALAPLALLRPGSRRAVLVLWGYVAYLFATWWLLTHRLDRFWLPILPPLAVLAGIGADWVRSRLWTLILSFVLATGIAVNLVDVTLAITALNQWTDDLNRLRVEVPRMLNAPLARLDAELPPDAVPLLVGQASVFHLNHRVVYNTVFDREILETIARDRSPDEIRAEFQRRGITHVYVDWSEIERHRKPGGYGFTDFVTPERLAGMVASGILEPVQRLGPQHELYRVR